MESVTQFYGIPDDVLKDLLKQAYESSMMQVPSHTLKDMITEIFLYRENPVEDEVIQ